MKKIILLFLMFSAVALAEWKVGAFHTDDGETATTFATFDNKTESVLAISVVVEDYGGYSFVSIVNEKIQEEDNLCLIIKDSSGDSINYSIFNGDVIDSGAIIMGGETKRGDKLAKMLYNGKSAKLYNNDTDELLASFDLNGIKQIIQKNVGSSYWYRRILNSIYD